MTPAPLSRRGTVDWSGENPCMYLKDAADGAFVTLVTFFRVVLSPHGRGHALVLVEAPLLDRSHPEALNVCVTDNEPLARWLVAGFVPSFRPFRGIPALAGLEYRRLAGVAASGDARASWVEWVKGDGVEATLTWEELGAPFLIDLPTDSAPTGCHQLVSLFVDAAQVTATVNGRPLRGRAFPREFLGRQSSWAFLAFSETWIRV